MAVSIRNIKKFIDDHPELADREKEILVAARKVGYKNIVSGGTATELMGDMAEQFFQEIIKDAEHLQIALEDFLKA